MAFLNPFSLAMAVFVFSVASTVWLMIYRLYLSPVAAFPGAFWPKVTFWYEFYYEWIKPGQYHQKIHEMHEKYGPIIRVTPDEIHISDGPFYHDLFVSFNARKTDAYARSAQGTGYEDIFALLSTHEGHKIIRDPVEKLYSKISTHEPQVMGVVKIFCDRLSKEKDMGKPFNISYACRSLSLDVVTVATFQDPSNYLREPSFNKNFFDVQKSGLIHIPLFAHLPFVARMLTTPLLDFISSRIPELREWIEKTHRQTFKEELQEPTMKLQGRTSIWKRGLLATRIGQLIQQNGFYHSSHTLETIITHLATDVQQRQCLKDELAMFWKNNPGAQSSWSALRRLPYLSACINEGLRLGTGSMKRSPRVFAHDETPYKDWVIPRKTPISMTTYYMHMDPVVFPEPEKFDPKRWLDADSESQLHTYFVPFAKGSRSCVGMNIALMQLYFTISQLYQPGSPELQLFESDEDDVRLVHGYIFPQPRLDSPGVKVLVHSPSNAG